jgi:hypothetical protein
MNTPAHLALSLAVLGRRASLREWAVIGAGAILPDLVLYLRYAASGQITDAAGGALRVAIDLFNSVPFYAVALALELIVGRRWLILLAGSALLHVLTDFVMHADDARAHFWPLTRWVFHSPVSFWDHAHYGRWVGLLEGALFAACMVVILRRHRAVWVQAVVLALTGVYALSFVHFLGHAFADRHWAPW